MDVIDWNGPEVVILAIIVVGVYSFVLSCWKEDKSERV